MHSIISDMIDYNHVLGKNFNLEISSFQVPTSLIILLVSGFACWNSRAFWIDN
jgi:hypothetical protein